MNFNVIAQQIMKQGFTRDEALRMIQEHLEVAVAKLIVSMEAEKASRIKCEKDFPNQRRQRC